MRKVGRRSKISMSCVRASCGILYWYFFWKPATFCRPAKQEVVTQQPSNNFRCLACNTNCMRGEKGWGREKEREGTTPFHLSLVAHSFKLVRHISCNCNCNSCCCYCNCNCNSSNNNNNKDSLSACFLNQQNEPATGWQSLLIRQRLCLPSSASQHDHNVSHNNAN